MSDCEKIRELSDRFRRTFAGGIVTVTRGIAAREDAAAIIEKVKTFEAFNADNDPYGEHDFGAFDHGGDKIFWKIDAYDANLRWGSPDPADPALTTRALTIMLAEEY